MAAYQERLHKARQFVKGNRLYCIVVVIVIIALLGNLLFSSNVDSAETEITGTEASQSEVLEETETSQWRFYWTDLYMLAIGGGFCSIMIIRERKKAKEKLQ